jgi:aspartate racemase
VGLIATLYTMEDGFIANRVRERFGVETLTPETSGSRQELHRIIQHELSMGLFKPESKAYVLQEIEALRKRGAQGIVLGCTEFPLHVRPEDVAIPSFDTTALHARMALDFVLGK